MLIAGGRPFLARDVGPFGLTAVAFRALVRSRAVRRVFRGCWVDARVPDDRALRIAAVDLVRPDDAIACDATAAYLHGLDVLPPGRRDDFTPSFVVPLHTVRIVRPEVRCREAIIPTADVTELAGLPVTTPVRTCSDLLRTLYRPYALAAADAFAAAGLIEPGDLIHHVAELRGYRGIVQARSLAVLVDPGSESPGESWTRLRIHDAGFPPPRVQWRAELRDGRRRRLDLAYPARRIACEFDGRDVHTSPRDLAHDAERRQQLTDEQGWRWVVARRESLFGSEPVFERDLGALLGMEPLARTWGTR